MIQVSICSRTHHIISYRRTILKHILLVEILDVYKQSEDFIKIGAYVKGINKDTDYAISMIDKINDFLKQDIDKQFSMEDTINIMVKLLK